MSKPLKDAAENLLIVALYLGVVIAVLCFVAWGNARSGGNENGNIAQCTGAQSC